MPNESQITILSDPAPERSLADETYHLLRQDILTSRLAGGTAVQERRLAAELGVSRSPMRDALGRLEGQGFLVRNAKGGLIVRNVTLQDYLHAISMRMLIEPSAAAAACDNIGADTIDTLFEVLDALDNNPDPDSAIVADFDDGLHGSIAEASGNPFMADTIKQMRRYTTIFENKRKLPQRKPGLAAHRSILNALKNGCPEEAQLAMTDHLIAVRQGVLNTY